MSVVDVAELPPKRNVASLNRLTLAKDLRKRSQPKASVIVAGKAERKTWRAKQRDPA